MTHRALVASAILALCLSGAANAGREEKAEDFMQLHKVEIAFYQAGSTKNLDLMLSLFANDAALTG
jgi:hypothetical protein